MKPKFMDYYRKMGLNIAYYRKDSVFTQEASGAKLGVEQTYISKIENATIGISLDTLSSLARALQVEPYKLLQLRD